MIEFGPFAVSSSGSLSVRPGAAPRLLFAWKGCGCAAWLEHKRLRLSAIAGRIPSTAEPGADRARTFEALAEMPVELPPGWRLRLTADHRLCLETEAAADTSAAGLVATLVRFALALDPYLDRLEAAGVGKLNT